MEKNPKIIKNSRLILLTLFLRVVIYSKVMGMKLMVLWPDTNPNAIEYEMQYFPLNEFLTELRRESFHFFNGNAKKS